MQHCIIYLSLEITLINIKSEMEPVCQIPTGQRRNDKLRGHFMWLLGCRSNPTLVPVPNTMKVCGGDNMEKVQLALKLYVYRDGVLNDKVKVVLTSNPSSLKNTRHHNLTK